MKLGINEFYLTVFISAGIGTTIAQIIFNLLVSHVLEINRYKIGLKMKNKRDLANELIEFVNLEREWNNTYDSDIYKKSNILSDRLASSGLKKASELLDKYTSKKRHLKLILDKMFRFRSTVTYDEKEFTKDFLDTSHSVDNLHMEIIKEVEKITR